MTRRTTYFKCPNCQALTSVVCSGGRNKRNRVCKNCNCSFRTIEIDGVEAIEQIYRQGDDCEPVDDIDNEIDDSCFTYKNYAQARRAVFSEAISDFRNFGEVQPDTKAKHSLVLSMKRKGKLR